MCNFVTFKMLISFVSFITVFVYIPSANTLQSNSSRLLSFQECVESKGHPSKTELIVTRTSNPSLYKTLNHQWNLRIRYIDPLAYFLPKNTKDVQLAVLCASTTDIRVIPKSGGHSYESYSFGNPDTIVIDFFFMRKVSVDKDKGEARIQPGALLSEVYYKLWKNGKFGIPLGSCLQVGMGGYVLGGGQSPLSDTFGYTIDYVIEMGMVDSKGLVHKVNNVTNQNLFWALRGVGSGYIGIVTSFKFKLFKAANFEVFTVNINYDLKYSTDILASYQKWLNWTTIHAPALHSEIFTNGNGISSNGGPEIHAAVWDTRDRTVSKTDERNKFLIRNIKKFFPSHGNLTERTYASILDYIKQFSLTPIISNETMSEVDLENVHRGNTSKQWVKQKTYHVKSFVSQNVLENMGKILQRIPDRSVSVAFMSEGGAIHNPSPSSMNYIHRRSLYSVIIRYEGDPDKNEVAKGWSWIEQYVQAAQPTDSGETYQNYVDGDLKDYLQRYYGDNLPRLIRTKREWDPNNYFRNPQSIPIE